MNKQDWFICPSRPQTFFFPLTGKKHRGLYLIILAVRRSRTQMQWN